MPSVRFFGLVILEWNERINAREVQDLLQCWNCKKKIITTITSEDTLEIAEALVDGYLDAAELSDDAARVEALQRLAETAISRLAWLRSLAAH